MHAHPTPGAPELKSQPAGEGCCRGHDERLHKGRQVMIVLERGNLILQRSPKVPLHRQEALDRGDGWLRQVEGLLAWPQRSRWRTWVSQCQAWEPQDRLLPAGLPTLWRTRHPHAGGSPVCADKRDAQQALTAQPTLPGQKAQVPAHCAGAPTGAGSLETGAWQRPRQSTAPCTPPPTADCPSAAGPSVWKVAAPRHQ